MAGKGKFEPRRNTDRHKTTRFTKKAPTSAIPPTHPKPPEGYVFVPKGDVYVTRKCTTLTQEGGQDVHIVYNHNATRLGLHVPKRVWKRVLLEAAQTAQKRAEAVRRKDERDRAKAKAMLQKRYPNMPLSDLEKVLKHAFMKGSGRVGRTSRESVERRASLAVGAHIRHNHTGYDDVLDRGQMSREQARHQVWKTVRDVKLDWAGKAPDTPGKTNSQA